MRRVRRGDIEKIYKLNQSPITYKLWGAGGGGGVGKDITFR